MIEWSVGSGRLCLFRSKFHDGLPWAITSHRAFSPAQRASTGVKDELLRLSVGIEDPSDILEDLEQAFRQL